MVFLLSHLAARLCHCRLNLVPGIPERGWLPEMSENISTSSAVLGHQVTGHVLLMNLRISLRLLKAIANI